MKFLRKVNVAFAGFEVSDHRVVFEVTKSLISYPNQALIKIYNLDDTQRNQIEEQFSTIQLFAGYENLVLLFSGDIVNVVHRKEPMDWVTEIYGGDATKVLNEAVINLALAPGSTIEQQYNALIERIPGVVKGTTEGIKECLSRKQSLLRKLELTGNIKDWLRKIVEECLIDFSINEGIAETTVKNQPLTDVPIVTINQNSGMIGAPERTDVGVTVKNLLLPELKLGRRIQIEAITTDLNVGNLFFRKIPPIRNQGVYRIDKLVHRGDTHDNPWETEIHGRILS